MTILNGRNDGTIGGKSERPSMKPGLKFILRYRSFTNWVKTFDEYQRQASKKGFMVDFRKSNDLECPATLTKMPCKGQLSEWRDLNECVFHICEDPFEFGKFN